ncbi:MAG TPA: xanthine dehydrogenase family protein molybdopterin-binding subunit [Gemmatimonadales bacterium]|nr:xanthine dehydrogenase family protein molybdopterin-binding subunit [Gemmatimonadales bacterium]
MPNTQVSRREFIKVGAATGAGLTLAFSLAGCGRGERGGATSAAPAPPAFAPNAFVKVGSDGSVTVVAKHLEMGQGTYTGLATILAEELDADWSRVRVEGAPADASKYNNLLLGPIQGTGGSTAMANSYDQLRKAGATARAMLVAAAAQDWGVDPSGLATEAGVVSDPKSGKRADYGSLAMKAAGLPVPQTVQLKDPKDFRLIGKVAPRVDAKDKSTGRAVFTQDMYLEGMLTAVVAHPPRFGAKVKSFDGSAAKGVKGVREVVQVPNGVAVVAEGFWPAKQGRDLLKVEWDESGAMAQGTDEIAAQFRELGSKPGLVARKDGNIEAALAGHKVIEASYEVPYLAHATMEPMDCVVRLGPDRCEIWNGEQLQTPDQGAIAHLTGLKPEQVFLNQLYAGGSFGRRASSTSDYVLEAVSIAKAIAGRAPVKLVWTREDDTRAGSFRPMTSHFLRGAVDGSGHPVAWHQRIVGQSIGVGTPFESFLVKDGIDATSVEGAATTRYAIPNLQVELHSPVLPVPVLWWRSVGNTHTAFAVESFIDELAAAGHKDPVELRRSLLAKSPRHLGVLNLAAQKAGWGTPLPAGRARGVAVHESFSSFVAEVAEVSVEDGKPRVHRVVAAVDCGIAINPDVIRMQVESAVAYGLSAALYGAITLKEGRVIEGNFDTYRPLRISDMPQVEVHIVPSTEPPTGIGEPGLPPIAPAVANALYKLTGKRIRKLPISL